MAPRRKKPPQPSPLDAEIVRLLDGSRHRALGLPPEALLADLEQLAEEGRVPRASEAAEEAGISPEGLGDAVRRAMKARPSRSSKTSRATVEIPLGKGRIAALAYVPVEPVFRHKPYFILHTANDNPRFTLQGWAAHLAASFLRARMQVVQPVDEPMPEDYYALNPPRRPRYDPPPPPPPSTGIAAWLARRKAELGVVESPESIERLGPDPTAERVKVVVLLAAQTKGGQIDDIWLRDTLVGELTLLVVVDGQDMTIGLTHARNGSSQWEDAPEWLWIVAGIPKGTRGSSWEKRKAEVNKRILFWARTPGPDRIRVRGQEAVQWVIGPRSGIDWRPPEITGEDYYALNPSPRPPSRSPRS